MTAYLFYDTWIAALALLPALYLLEVPAVPEKRAGIQGTVSGQYPNHGISSQRGIFRGECAARDCPGSEAVVSEGQQNTKRI